MSQKRTPKMVSRQVSLTKIPNTSRPQSFKIPQEQKSPLLLQSPKHVPIKASKQNFFNKETVDIERTKSRIILVPDFLSSCPNLATLDLSYNLIEIVPGDLALLPRLHTINFSHNRISFIAEEFFNRKNNSIKFFDLSSNYITSISNRIDNLEALEYLNIESNDLQRIPLSIINIEGLKELRFEWNIYTDQNNQWDASIKKLDLVKFRRLLSIFLKETKEEDIGFAEYSKMLSFKYSKGEIEAPQSHRKTDPQQIFHQCLIALQNKHLGMMRFLLQSYPDILHNEKVSNVNQAKNSKAETFGSILLNHSVEINDIRFTNCLFTHGAKPQNEESLMFSSINSLCPGLVDTLLKNGLPVTLRFPNHNLATPLILAVQKYPKSPLASLKIIQNLLRYGASPLERDSFNKTSLHYAVEFGEQHLFSVLSKVVYHFQFDDLVVDDFSNQFETLLHMAARSNTIEMLRNVAIFRPFDHFFENQKGQSALDLIPKCYLTSRKILMHSMKANLQRVARNVEKNRIQETPVQSTIQAASEHNMDFSNCDAFSRPIASSLLAIPQVKKQDMISKMITDSRKKPLVTKNCKFKLINLNATTDVNFSSRNRLPNIDQVLDFEKKPGLTIKKSLQPKNGPIKTRKNLRRLQTIKDSTRHTKIENPFKKVRTETDFDISMEDFSKIEENPSSDEDPEPIPISSFRGFSARRSSREHLRQTNRSIDKITTAFSPRSLGDRMLSSKSLKGTRMMSSVIRELIESTQNLTKKKFLRTHCCYKTLEKLLVSPCILDWAHETIQTSRAQMALEGGLSSSSAKEEKWGKLLKNLVFLVDTQCQLSAFQQTVSYIFNDIESELPLKIYWSDFERLFPSVKEQSSKKQEFISGTYDLVAKIFYTCIVQFEVGLFNKGLGPMEILLKGVEVLKMTGYPGSSEVFDDLLAQIQSKGHNKLLGYNLINGAKILKSTQKSTRNGFFEFGAMGKPSGNMKTIPNETENRSIKNTSSCNSLIPSAITIKNPKMNESLYANRVVFLTEE